jgi:sarcosine oxidase
MGLATSYALARDGVDVTLLERFEVGNSHGSSHAPTRVFRTLYGDPLYVRMALDAIPLWRALGDDLLQMTGGFQVDSAGVLAHVRSTIDGCGAGAELVTADEVKERAPWLDVDRPALFAADVGVIAAERTLAAFRSRAEASGAEVSELAVVESLEQRSDGVTIVSSSGSLDARVCVVAAGGWARDLLAPLGIDLPVKVTREQVQYLRGDTATMPFVHNVGHWVYGLPGLDPGDPMKLGEHGAGPEVTADDRSFEIDAVAAKRMSSYVSRYLPGVDPEPVGSDTCLYTTTPDEDFVVDRCNNVVVVSPCSGHGFKFAPLIGELACSLATGREPSVPLDRFSLSRFSR